MGPRPQSIDELVADSRSIDVRHFFELSATLHDHAEDPAPVIDVPDCARDLLEGLTSYGG